jgi:hypothetical protein
MLHKLQTRVCAEQICEYRNVSLSLADQQISFNSITAESYNRHIVLIPESPKIAEIPEFYHFKNPFRAVRQFHIHVMQYGQSLLVFR